MEELQLGAAAFIGGGRLTVDGEQGWCIERLGVPLGLARGRLRCWAMGRHGGWRGGERRELGVGDGLGSIWAAHGLARRRAPGGLGMLLGVVRAQEGAGVQ